MSGRRLRIISDIHYGEGPSLVRNLDALTPLFEGADQMIFNGDSLETRFLDKFPDTVEFKAEFDAFTTSHADRIKLVSGNHDPDITTAHHIDLAEGAVLVTHGDTMFPDLAPWGWESQHFRAEQERRLAATPESERHTFDTRLRVCKETVIAIRHLSPRFISRKDGSIARWLRFIRRVLRADRIIPCWFQVPDRAALLAETFRPAARVVIVGHTHMPGVWTARGRTVINTGSFMPPLGARAVDLVDGRIEVRRINLHRGEARLGNSVRTIEVKRPA